MMNFFELDDLIDEQRRVATPYFEFLRERSMSLGLYTLPAEGVDPQMPHAEDEVYYVVSGQAMITVGDPSTSSGQAERPVQPGTLIFVPANVAHRFHTIAEELTLLVLFAPAEGTNQISTQRAGGVTPITG